MESCCQSSVGLAEIINTCRAFYNSACLELYRNAIPGNNVENLNNFIIKSKVPRKSMKSFFRNLQTFFPFLHDLRFSVSLALNKLINRPHDADFNALELFNPPPLSHIIDIGSNRGEAIASMLLFCKDMSIVGFEPNPLVFVKLKKRFGDHPQVMLHNLGLGNSSDRFDLYVPFYRNWMFDGLASFNRKNAADWLETRMWRYRPELQTIRQVQCDIRKLDDFAFKPYFIKIDVQGYELNVLHGAVETLKSCYPILLIESITEEIIQFLQPLGYKCYHFEHGAFEPGRGWPNTFCITDDKLNDMTVKKKIPVY